MSSATTRYVHAGVQAIEEYDGTTSGANLRRLYVFGERIDQIVAMEAPDAADVDQDQNTTEVLRFSFHTQLIGSVTQVTAPSGSVAESYDYDPYGKPTIKDGGGSTISASAIGNSYLFTARQLDAETGLYYYRARHYSPELRRFVQRDPLEYVMGMNPSVYCSMSPAGRTDGRGLADLSAAAAAELTRDANGAVSTGAEAATAALRSAITVWGAIALAKWHSQWYSPGSQQQGRGDAIRHCIWLCAMVRDFENQGNTKDASERAARAVGVENERGETPGRSTDMDTANNEEGIKCGQDRGSGSCNECCKKKLSSGTLVVNRPHATIAPAPLLPRSVCMPGSEPEGDPPFGRRSNRLVGGSSFARRCQ